MWISLACAAAVLLLAGCSEEPASELPSRSEPSKTETAPPLPSPTSETPLDERPKPSTSSEGAGQAVQTYYALIEARKYADAYMLREPAKGAPTEAEFAANFDRFAEYHVTIGRPSEPVEAEGWLYVEVPVQPYGRMRDGSPIASAGTVTLRRRKNGGEWRIFTKG